MTQPSSTPSVSSSPSKAVYSRGESLPALLIRYTKRLPRELPPVTDSEPAKSGPFSRLVLQPEQPGQSDPVEEASASQPEGDMVFANPSRLGAGSSRFQKTPLHLAIVSGDGNKVLGLIQSMAINRADFNHATSLGETALDYAEIYKKRLGSQAGMIIQTLRSHGAKSGRNNREHLFQQLLNDNRTIDS